MESWKSERKEYSEEEGRAALKMVRLLNGFTFRRGIEVLELAKKVLADAKINSLEVGEEGNGKEILL